MQYIERKLIQMGGIVTLNLMRSELFHGLAYESSKQARLLTALPSSLRRRVRNDDAATLDTIKLILNV
jgi:hypothetical protein